MHRKATRRSVATMGKKHRTGQHNVFCWVPTNGAVFNDIQTELSTLYVVGENAYEMIIKPNQRPLDAKMNMKELNFPRQVYIRSLDPDMTMPIKELRRKVADCARAYMRAPADRFGDLDIFEALD